MPNNCWVITLSLSGKISICTLLVNLPYINSINFKGDFTQLSVKKSLLYYENRYLNAGISIKYPVREGRRHICKTSLKA